MTTIFSRRKYYLLTLGIILLTLGFVLMSGPTKVQGEFNEAIFNFRRLTLAPILVLGAYMLLVFTIFSRSDFRKTT